MTNKDLITRTDPTGGLTKFRRLNDIFGEFHQMFDGLMGKSFNSFPVAIKQDIFDQLQSKATLPKINVIDNDTFYEVEAALAGFDKGDIALEFKDNSLFLSAKKSVEDVEEDRDRRFLRREIAQRSFRRVITFPEKVDVAKMDSAFENGLLLITLGKEIAVERDDAVKIVVK